MKVLITAPNLDTRKNVSGISSIVSTIINNNKDVTYIHFVAGREDGEIKVTLVKRFIIIFSSYLLLIKYFVRDEVDIVHLNLPLNLKSVLRDCVIFLIAKAFRKKIVSHLHGGRYLVITPSNLIVYNMIRFILTKSSLVIVLSEYEREMIRKLYLVANASVMQNVVDDIFVRNVRLKQEKKSVLFLGRLHESKGLTVAIEAFKLVVKRYNHFEFNICGSGPLEEYVLAEVKACPNIKFHGIVQGNSKMEFLSKNSIFLLPSLYGEGLPIALLEAMASGLVPVVTDDGSMKHIIIDGHNGLVVQKDNVFDIVSKLQTLIEDDILYDLISKNSMNYIQHQFSVSKYIERLNCIYSLL